MATGTVHKTFTCGGKLSCVMTSGVRSCKGVNDLVAAETVRKHSPVEVSWAVNSGVRSCKGVNDLVAAETVRKHSPVEVSWTVNSGVRSC